MPDRPLPGALPRASSRGIRRPRWHVLALACFALPALAESLFGLDLDEEKAWTEIEQQLPAFPEAENLIPFTVGAVRGTRFLVDGKSLSVGADGVLRYTLVVISPAGAKNVSHEGMRCTTRERRFYAFGQGDGTWSKSRNNKWVRIQGTTNNHYVELYNNYFCTIGESSGSSAENARRTLLAGGKKPEGGH